MGLDMYLAKKNYVKNWDYMKKPERHSFIIKKGGKETEIKPERISYIIEEVARWRKANAIHKWFVDNVQEGEDDCKEYYVSGEQLQELLNKCNEVLKVAKIKKGKVSNGYTIKDGKKKYNFVDGKVVTNAKEIAEILPTEDGFFFDCTDYDEYYIKDIEYTTKTLTELIKEEDGEFYYSSSW